MNRFIICAFIFCVSFSGLQAQKNIHSNTWHNQSRFLRYHPEGEDFVITNGNKRFTRALYGTNTAFRVEAGDLPEFALYMPGMGGNMHFAILSDKGFIWLNSAKTITARYRPGTMIYEITDSILGDGKLFLQILAMSDDEGLIVSVRFENVIAPVKFLTVFGGASNKKFSRSGDIGADPESSFYLKKENCITNTFEISKNAFTLKYGSSDPDKQKKVFGTFPEIAALKIADATYIDDPVQLISSASNKYPVLVSVLPVKDQNIYYFAIQNPGKRNEIKYAELPKLFENADFFRKELANRVKVNTPDSFINTIGGALSIAADAIWDSTSFMHGAVAWRMALNGWRGAYVADPLGWHDRAKMHFREYAKAQYTEPDSGPCVPDIKENLARQQETPGISLYTSGYISRNPGKISKPHHYDMNLVFIDQLLTHFKWTGDTAFIREMWPVIKRHLAWEKRNFDNNNDGLFDAYCCIWASDALQYSGGGVTHSSAYNYRANKIAAYLAAIVGDDPKPFAAEVDKICKAIQSSLWLKNLGWYAEYKDLLGLQLRHSSAGLWTVYHTIDSEVPGPFEAYQTLQYVNNYIPHIPIKAQGLGNNGYYTLSTTNWMPYTWSINNVAMAEVLHTSLAFWQGGRINEAFLLWKSALLESMYLGSSAGNIQQITFYDAFRGELYRDFADPIGMTARTLVEGLFGISPDALTGTLFISPGLPTYWKHASLHIPDIDFSYKSTENKDSYTIIQRFPRLLNLSFSTLTKKDGVKAVYINKKKILWDVIDSVIGKPQIGFTFEVKDTFNIEIIWEGSNPDIARYPKEIAVTDTLSVNTGMAEIKEIYDPQKVLYNTSYELNTLKTSLNPDTGKRTFFIKVDQNQVSWWLPVNICVTNPVDIIGPKILDNKSISFLVCNNSRQAVKGPIVINYDIKKDYSIELRSYETSKEIVIESSKVIPGSNEIEYRYAEGKSIRKEIIYWDTNYSGKPNWKTIDLTARYNEKVTNIFKNKYVSPRPSVPTLQLPVQGIGNWCYSKVVPEINDSGIKKLAGNTGIFTLPQGIPFKIITDDTKNNILFTSLWDNYPDSVEIPLTGNARHAYFLMAGTTNPMQSRFLNGEIIIEYQDGSSSVRKLINPETWWPIEQDYYTDGYAFPLFAPKPIRVHLKTGLISNNFAGYETIKGFTTTAIDGGAATVLDLPLDSTKKLRRLVLKSIANDVIIGLMAVTLDMQ